MAWCCGQWWCMLWHFFKTLLVPKAVFVSPGEYSYLGTTLRQADIEPMPSLSDIRQLIALYGVLPLGKSKQLWFTRFIGQTLILSHHTHVFSKNMWKNHLSYWYYLTVVKDVIVLTDIHRLLFSHGVYGWSYQRYTIIIQYVLSPNNHEEYIFSINILI